MIRRILSVIILLITVPFVNGEEPNFKIFEKSAPPMIFVKKSPKLVIVKQLNEIEYDELIKVVKQGKIITVAVGDPTLKADYFVRSIKDTENGIWLCYMDNGMPKMKIDNPAPKQQQFFQIPTYRSGST